MNEHTPSAGSWRYDRPAQPVGSRKRPVFEILAGSCETVATTTDERHARLIAAAPDLMAALRLTMTALVICRAGSGSTFDINGVLGQAEAAMDRATGATP